MNSKTQPASGTFRSGEPLRASSLDSAFERQESVARRHVAGVHGAWGIVLGLGVRLCHSEPKIEVEPGAALDAFGHWITLDKSLCLSLPRVDDDEPHSPWLLVIRHNAAPRFALESQAGPPGVSIVLARWDGHSLVVVDRRAARPRRSLSPPRMMAGGKTLNVAAIARDDGQGWTARVDLGPTTLEGEVAAFVWPSGIVETGASWSISNIHPNGFTFSAAGWPLLTDPETKLLSLSLNWIIVEIGQGTDTSPIPTSDGVNEMVATTRPVPASPGGTQSPYAIPPPLAFAPGSMLKAEELNAALARLDAIHALHNRTMHPRGIVIGLVVTTEPDGLTLRVQPGLAIDAQGHERTLDAAKFIDPPDEARSVEKVTRTLVLAHGPNDTESVLGWRDPNTTTGPKRVDKLRDLVLASVEYAKGKAMVTSTVRRDVRPPDIRAGITANRATEWTLWSSPTNSTPKGVSTRVSWPGGAENPGPSPVLLAQLVGDRLHGSTILDGPAFVAAGPDAHGFEFVVAFPDGKPSTWAVESRASQSQLLDDLRHNLNWRVAWISIGTDS